MFHKKLICFILLLLFAFNTAEAGILVVKSNGVTLTGADGIEYIGTDGVTLTGADGFLSYASNGVTLTGADGVTLTGADGVTLTGADGVTYTGGNGVTLTGADGVTLTGADGITLTGADGVTLTGADGTTYQANSINIVRPAGITLTGADGITLTGADGNDGNSTTGLNSVDPELAIMLNNATDDSTINAVIVFHNLPDETDLNSLRQIGILGGTRYRMLPMIAVTATRDQILAVSRLSNVRSIYGNRTLTLNSDPFFKKTGIQRVAADRDLQNRNSGLPVSGKNVTVAVLDTGVNSQHSDLAGKVVQNVRLVDNQSAPAGFINPQPVENLVNTDPLSGHGTFVSGIIAASGVSSGGKYSGVAPGAKILGLSAGDLNLSFILAGFDYLLERGAAYNTRVVNCSFSSNTVFDYNDPVNVATKLLTERGINVVFSAGNTGAGNGTLNPYAAAPWVVSVGATDENGKLANFSSRGVFGSRNQNPSLVAAGVNVVSLRGGVNQTGTLGVAAGADVQRLTPAELPFYTTASGTSFTAPQVAGAIALMLEANPQLTPAQVKKILQQTSTPLPGNFYHEVGAGMLNTYAAVLEASFPERRIGIQRSVFEGRSVRFRHTVSNTFEKTVYPGSVDSNSFALPANTIQAGISISWGLGVNDLSLKLYDSQNNLIGNSNYLNAPGLTGNREKLTLLNPAAQTLQAVVAHTGGLGTSQKYFGAVEITQVEYPRLTDIETLTPAWQAIVKESLRTFQVSTQGRKFKPQMTVSRAELADSLLRSGRVTQYVAGTPLYTDVRDARTRNAVESVQTNETGKLFFDATSGGRFRPFDSASKLVTAVALVKAAGLENQASTAVLPANLTDAALIPAEYRGYVAVALQKGLVVIDNNKFNPDRPLTRLELSLGMVNLLHLGN